MGKTNADLAALIGKAKTPAKAPAAAISKTPKLSDSETLEVKDSKSRTARRQPQRQTQAAGPKYQTMVAKEARLRPDQVDELSQVARQLQRSRSAAGERITANTLIRVAVDRLLAEAASLSGDDEAALLKSLG